ncbi:MAG: response regulator transcription factor [Burkholderiales bacterium]|nr:response regulator transcription factor [Burkholderiales bacterium]
MAMKLLLVDDHGLFRGGLRLLLGAMQRDLEILEADSCGEALALMQQHLDIRLCLIDLTLRGENGMSVIALLKDINPAVVTVIVSGDERPATIVAALDAGAMGYVPKSVSPEIMVQALQLVLAGGIYLPSSLLESNQQQSESEESADSKLVGLTERQLQVLQCLLRGWPNKLICRDLNISDNTLKGHLAAIYRTLDVKSRTQAVIAAGRLGLRVGLEGVIQ